MSVVCVFLCVCVFVCVLGVSTYVSGGFRESQADTLPPTYTHYTKRYTCQNTHYLRPTLNEYVQITHTKSPQKANPQKHTLKQTPKRNTD